MICSLGNTNSSGNNWVSNVIRTMKDLDTDAQHRFVLVSSNTKHFMLPSGMQTSEIQSQTTINFKHCIVLTSCAGPVKVKLKKKKKKKVPI